MVKEVGMRNVPPDIALLIELHGKGMSCTDIARAVGRTGYTVARRLQAAGINTSSKGRPRPHTKKDNQARDASILECHSAGVTHDENARRHGLSSGRIREIIYAARESNG